MLPNPKNPHLQEGMFITTLPKEIIKPLSLYNSMNSAVYSLQTESIQVRVSKTDFYSSMYRVQKIYKVSNIRNAYLITKEK